MGPWTHDRLVALAHPWPVGWLFPPRPGEPERVVNLFAGAGGWEQGLRLLDSDGSGFDVVGVEIGWDASATAVAAGHRRIVADVRTLDPAHPALRYVAGLTVSAPCQVWTPAGKREGHQERNIDLLLDTFSLACEATFGHWHDSGECCDTDDCGICSDPEWDGYGGFTGPLLTYDEARCLVPQMTDERIGLIAETLIWSLALTARYDNLRWLAMEQSSALPEIVLDALRDELYIADWCSAKYQVLDAADTGLASHRRRVYLVAGRHHYVNIQAMQPTTPIAARTAAQALGWPEGVRVNTRGNRRTSGGNEWSADKTAPGITSKVRGWYWADDKERRFTVPEAALLVGMPADYPWTGSRSSACQQLGDIVAVPEAARVIGSLLGKPWEEPVTNYLDEIYRPENRAIAAPADGPPVSRRAAAATAASQVPMLPGLDDWTPATVPARSAPPQQLAPRAR
ncbi:DNA cytosine methyltransferase [Kitasatospora aureofaciens]|uniref:DNA cytosine methyltransferase n=1 Tax=Kitasatospora aureofaciens TaxID=1894 RepID=UPI001C470950|nr:DNA cytosine methyltransferase [Kitasatospora aureofaciens]MBV6695552.1 DNA cytosine methyltransferase [Kitasatospora aureofaciens]